jgi:hypothetical protein
MKNNITTPKEEEAISKAEESYTNKTIRNWWLAKTEEERRIMVRTYFIGANSENINTLYGIMPEEMEEIYNINIKEEEPKLETLQEAAKNYAENEIKNRGNDSDKLICSIDFIEGAKWQAEQDKHSDDVLKMCWDAASAYTIGSHKDFKQTHPDFKEWLEQFKKQATKG